MSNEMYSGGMCRNYLLGEYRLGQACPTSLFLNANIFFFFFFFSGKVINNNVNHMHRASTLVDMYKYIN
jgi:hypothetical protein